MDYMTAADAAEKWKISVVLVRKYCREGRIPNADCIDNTWMIPVDAKRPDRSSLPPKPDDVLPTLAKRLMHQKSKRNFHGLYDYVQIYFTYSSSRMASNRLTRNQVESIFRKGKVKESFEPVKVSDCIEVMNHCLCVDDILDHIADPLTQKLIQKLHHTLMFGTVDHRKQLVNPGVYRPYSVPPRFKDSPLSDKVAKLMSTLLSEYEAKPDIELKEILEFHVRFEQIFPFEDGNGRVGRLIMFKECLRHDVMPFIIDDKHRKQYLAGIRNWDEDRYCLLEVAYASQERFEKIVARCKLGEYRQKDFQDMYAAFEEELPVEEFDDDVPKDGLSSTSQKKQRKRRR